jgi:hypothetical protein
MRIACSGAVDSSVPKEADALRDDLYGLLPDVGKNSIIALFPSGG